LVVPGVRPGGVLVLVEIEGHLPHRGVSTGLAVLAEGGGGSVDRRLLRTGGGVIARREGEDGRRGAGPGEQGPTRQRRRSGAAEQGVSWQHGSSSHRMTGVWGRHGTEIVRSPPPSRCAVRRIGREHL